MITSQEFVKKYDDTHDFVIFSSLINFTLQTFASNSDSGNRQKSGNQRNQGRNE